MKKQYVLKIIACIILTAILIGGNIISSFASEVDPTPTPEQEEDPGAPGDWSGAQKWSYFRANADGFIASCIGIVCNAATTEDVVTNFSRLIEAKTIQDNIDFDTWFWQNVKLTPNNPQAPSVSEPNDTNVTNINVSYEFKDILLQAAQETMAENPLGYTEAYIPSYNFMSTDSFTSYGTYKTIQEIIKNNNGFTFFRSPNGTGDASNKYTVIITVDRSKYDVNFIGTTTGGNFTNVRIEHDWSLLSTFPQETDGIDFRVYKHSTGVIGAPAKTISEAAANAGYSTSYNPSFQSDLKNMSSMPTNSSNSTVFTNSSKNDLVYVFSTINSYKNYNSGSPQPYYVSSNYTGSVTSGNSSYSSSQINSGNSSYSNVVNNIQSGMSADEVNRLVDTIMNNMNNGGGSGGSGGGSDDDDDGGSIIGNIIRKLGDFVSGLIDGIGGALESIVNSIVGYTDENGVEHPGIFQGLINLISSGVVGFLSAVFSFLPTEIVTVISAGIILSILFAVIHFIRGR